MLCAAARPGRGGWFDTEWGLDWLQARVQQRVFGALVINPKVPFTDAGIGTVTGQIKAALQEGVTNQLLGSPRR